MNRKNTEIRRTPYFYRVARQLSEFIAGLPLSAQDNNELVKLMVQQVEAAECGAYSCGFGDGEKASKWKNSHNLRKM